MCLGLSGSLVGCSRDVLPASIVGKCSLILLDLLGEDSHTEHAGRGPLAQKSLSYLLAGPIRPGLVHGRCI